MKRGRPPYDLMNVPRSAIEVAMGEMMREDVGEMAMDGESSEEMLGDHA